MPDEKSDAQGHQGEVESEMRAEKVRIDSAIESLKRARSQLDPIRGTGHNMRSAHRHLLKAEKGIKAVKRYVLADACHCC